MANYNSAHQGLVIDKAVTKAISIGKLVTATALRTIGTSDLSKTIVYDSAADADFTIPNDTTLGLSGDDGAFIEVYQKGTGVVNFVGSGGTIVRKWTGYPTSSQYVTQTLHRVGDNTWAVK